MDLTATATTGVVSLLSAFVGGRMALAGVDRASAAQERVAVLQRSADAARALAGAVAAFDYAVERFAAQDRHAALRQPIFDKQTGLRIAEQEHASALADLALSSKVRQVVQFSALYAQSLFDQGAEWAYTEDALVRACNWLLHGLRAHILQEETADTAVLPLHDLEALATWTPPDLPPRGRPLVRPRRAWWRRVLGW